MFHNLQKKELIRLVRKVLRGKANAREQEFVEQYYRYFDQDGSLPPPLSSMEREKLEQKMLEIIRDTTDCEDKGKLISFSGKSFLKLAAASVALIAISVLVYRYRDAFHTSGGAPEQAKVAARVISTDFGKQTRFTLKDGTRVWLNASSSLKFPDKFAAGERRVILSGEAYFEVADDRNKPFIVVAGNTEVRQLGTHFNVKAYGDDGTVTTTLLEGAVSVTQHAMRGIQLLNPGEQAVSYNTENHAIEVTRPGSLAAVAWKNGLFSFHHTGIDEVMRQLSRWYGIKVEYKNSPHVFLTGEISRNLPLVQVAHMIEYMGEVKLLVNGGTVTVMNQK